MEWTNAKRTVVDWRTESLLTKGYNQRVRLDTYSLNVWSTIIPLIFGEKNCPSTYPGKCPRTFGSNEVRFFLIILITFTHLFKLSSLIYSLKHFMKLYKSYALPILGTCDSTQSNCNRSTATVMASYSIKPLKWEDYVIIAIQLVQKFGWWFLFLFCFFSVVFIHWQIPHCGHPVRRIIHSFTDSYIHSFFSQINL